MNPNGEILDRPVFLQYLFEVYNANIEKTINDLPPLDEQRFEKLKKLQDKDIDVSDIPALTQEQLARFVSAKLLNRSLYRPVKIAGIKQ